jgi:CubicO group peptidase (beta-lactamase class C family)
VAAQLAHEGRIDFDGSIDEYLPDLTGTMGGRNIRVRHLGTHSSGYRGLSPTNPEHGYFYSWAKFAEFFRSTEQVFHPGSVFNYEHTESVILGEVVRRITGRPCEALMRDLILEPLELTTGSIEADALRSEVAVADHALDRSSGKYAVVRSVPYCDFWASSLSSMTASTVDLVTVGELLNGLRRVPGICDEAVDDVVRQAVVLPRSSGGPEKEVAPRSFGFGCARYADGVFGHNGSARGQTCGLRFCPRDGVVIVVALNCWDPYARDSLLDTLFQMLLPTHIAKSEVPQGCEQLKMDELVGTYRGCVQGLEIVVTRRQDRLVCALGGMAAGGARKLSVDVTVDETGRLRVQCPLRHLSVGFFREESTGVPAILVGLNAFKKM